MEEATADGVGGSDRSGKRKLFIGVLIICGWDYYNIFNH